MEEMEAIAYRYRFEDLNQFSLSNRRLRSSIINLLSVANQIKDNSV